MNYGSTKKSGFNQRNFIKSNERFIRIKELNTLINAADVVGIFSPETMDERTEATEWRMAMPTRKLARTKRKCECIDKNHIRANVRRQMLVTTNTARGRYGIKPNGENKYNDIFGKK